MKYIDAEKLKAEIERLKQLNKVHDDKDYAQYELDVACGYDTACEEILCSITSLQQEQESVAEQFAKIVRRNLIGIDKKAQQEFEQLYFEVTGNKMYGGYND